MITFSSISLVDSLFAVALLATQCSTNHMPKEVQRPRQITNTKATA